MESYFTYFFRLFLFSHFVVGDGGHNLMDRVPIILSYVRITLGKLFHLCFWLFFLYPSFVVANEPFFFFFFYYEELWQKDQYFNFHNCQGSFEF